MAKALIALTVWLCLASPAFAAQSKSHVKKPVQPAWSELSPAQQKVLAPLSTEWNAMDATRRKKWVAIADRYPKMKPQEQQRLQKNMTDWKLTPAERKAARDKYQTMQKLPPNKRREVAAQWRQYQQSLAAQPEISPSDPPAPPEPQSGEAPSPAPSPSGTATAGSPPPAPQ